MLDLAMLIVEMIRRYCYLVRTYSVAVYSEPIRKAMLYIDLNLANPISTKEIAADQFLSPNYLSSRFHEETGKTISDFILEKRIKHIPVSRNCRFRMLPFPWVLAMPAIFLSSLKKSWAFRRFSIKRVIRTNKKRSAAIFLRAHRSVLTFVWSNFTIRLDKPSFFKVSTGNPQESAQELTAV